MDPSHFHKYLVTQKSNDKVFLVRMNKLKLNNLQGGGEARAKHGREADIPTGAGSLTMLACSGSFLILLLAIILVAIVVARKRKIPAEPKTDVPIKTAAVLLREVPRRPPAPFGRREFVSAPTRDYDPFSREETRISIQTAALPKSATYVLNM